MDNERIFKKTEERFLNTFAESGIKGIGYKFISDPVSVLKYLRENVPPEDIEILPLAVSGLREFFIDTISDNQYLNDYLANDELSKEGVTAICTLLRQAEYTKQEAYNWFAYGGVSEQTYQTPEQKQIIAIIDKIYE